MLKKKKEIFLALATTCLAGLLGLVLIEGYYWKSGYTSLVCEICRFHPQLGWETIPDKTVTNGKVTYTTNSMGMRSGEVDFSRGHILLVGDSVTFGLGVNNDETVSHYLEKEQLEYQVLNLGVPGYGIGQYYLNLKRHIDTLNPKWIVLILYTANDLEETRKDTRFGISKPFFIYQNGGLLHLNPNISRFSCSNLYTRLRFVKYLIPKSLIDNCRSKVIERDKASPTITKLIDKIRILGMQRSIPTLIVLSPALTAIEAVGCKQSRPLGACLNYDHGFESYYRFFQKIMELYKLPYVDFLQHLVDYDKEGEIRSLYGNNGKDIHHYSPQGNTILAQAIAERLVLK
jgi:lysophospholipase L1-like esterase